jgi:hypothetical protein
MQIWDEGELVMDSLYLCETGEQLGRWLWWEVERKDLSVPSGTVYTACQQRLLRLVRVFRATCSEPYSEILLQLDALLTFSLVFMCFHAIQDGKSLIKLFDRRVRQDAKHPAPPTIQLCPAPFLGLSVQPCGELCGSAARFDFFTVGVI